MKKKIQYQGDFEKNFTTGVLHSHDYYDHMIGDYFYFGRLDPIVHNFYRTVVFGCVRDGEVDYCYGKDPLSCVLIITITVLFYVSFIISLVKNNLLSTAPGRFAFLAFIMFCCIAASYVPMFIFSSKEKERLLNYLGKLCEADDNKCF